MDVDGLLARIESEFTLEDVQAERVETVSVVALSEFEALVGKAVDEQTARLQVELDEARAQLADVGGGGLEAAAAEAALEAESRALEAQAEAEQRARAAEARAKQLERELDAVRGKGGGDGAGGGERAAELEGKLEALQERLAELEAELTEARGEADRAVELEGKLGELEAAKQAELDAQAARVAELEAQLATAGQGTEGGGGNAGAETASAPDAGEVTDADRQTARRLAEALLEEVFSDDEEATRASLADGTFRDDFSAPLAEARSTYERRTEPHVRADGDFFAEVLAEMEGRDW